MPASFSRVLEIKKPFRPQHLLIDSESPAVVGLRVTVFSERGIHIRQTLQDDGMMIVFVRILRLEARQCLYCYGNGFFISLRDVQLLKLAG